MKFVCEFRTFDGSFFRFYVEDFRSLTEALIYARDDERVISFHFEKLEREDLKNEISDF